MGVKNENKVWYKKWWAITIFVIIGLVIIGSFLPNSSNNQVTCNKPYILVGTSCCLDNNDNSICDNDETEVQSSGSQQQTNNICTPNWVCSSWYSCNSTEQQTRTCTDNNDCGTSSEKPLETQSCIPPVTMAWHEVATFSGTNDKTTDTFNIQGDRFKLTYTANPANEYSIFYLYVYQPGYTSYTESYDLNSGTDSSISYKGAGTYYLKVLAANLNSWQVKIEDYY